ncbi:type II toxin-antitoxin system prevent-host-death family antitoxin [Streptomyces sparsogenes]|uniref:type II toxin-antitoxin system prevent-host-death family antitoxin n=1 Tax=Streptomyces sparsogenes TaxID=67365 RepID=UPI0033C9093B
MSESDEHMGVSEARANMTEVIAKVRLLGMPVVLTRREKPQAVLVSHPFYEQAKVDRKLVELLSEVDPDLHKTLLSQAAPKKPNPRVVRRQRDTSSDG